MLGFMEDLRLSSLHRGLSEVLSQRATSIPSDPVSCIVIDSHEAAKMMSLQYEELQLLLPIIL